LGEIVPERFLLEHPQGFAREPFEAGATFFPAFRRFFDVGPVAVPKGLMELPCAIFPTVSFAFPDAQCGTNGARDVTCHTS